EGDRRLGDIGRVDCRAGLGIELRGVSDLWHVTIVAMDAAIVANIVEELSPPLAATVQAARVAQDLSVNALAERSGVSRAMIGKIERGEAQPTAVLLGRLSGALRKTLSYLVP